MLKLSGMAVTSAALAGKPPSKPLPLTTPSTSPLTILEVAPAEPSRPLPITARCRVRCCACKKADRSLSMLPTRPPTARWCIGMGSFCPRQVDGAMEEGTPLIPGGGHARYTFTPRPAGFRWYHTHTFAGKDLHKGQYTGEHGFLLIEPRDSPARYDQEIFLALHDWDGDLVASGDGAMDPVYECIDRQRPCPGFRRAAAGQDRSSAFCCTFLIPVPARCTGSPLPGIPSTSSRWMATAVPAAADGIHAPPGSCRADQRHRRDESSWQLGDGRGAQAHHGGRYGHCCGVRRQQW